MKCYKNNPLETKKKIITDKKGRDWVSCNVLGYIDSVGAVHVKGRIEELRRYGSEVFYPYMADEVIERDKKNILFSTTVFHKNNNAIVASVLLNPLSSVNEMLIINNAMKRCREKLPQQVVDVLRIKVFHDILDFPITESGKRNIRALEMTNL
jgi:acyl-CoA synthetase (AMP-forming)/AMP-acid ligase II